MVVSKSFTLSLVAAVGVVAYVCLGAPTARVSNVCFPTTGNILVVSDLHLNSDSTNIMPLCPFVPSRTNDIDSTTLAQLLNGIKGGLTNGQIAAPNCVIFLGDAARHSRLSSEEIIKDENHVFTKLLETFPANPIFYVCGNEDPIGLHDGPFYDPNQEPSNASPYTVAMNNGWSNGFLSTGDQYVPGGDNTYPCLITENTQYGYYAAYLQPGFRLITLNTVMFMLKRVSITEDEAQSELAWFSGQLAAAAASNESVLVATHVPFGTRLNTNEVEWVSSDQAVFLSLFRKYKGIIIGVLAGHTHMEEMRIVQDGSSNVGVLLNNAGMCTYSANSPAFKTIYYQTIDGQWALTDYKTFSFIYLTNSVPPEPELHTLYQFSEYYGESGGSSIIGSLTNVTAEKMLVYYTAGNTNYPGQILYPENIYVPLLRPIVPWLVLLFN